MALGRGSWEIWLRANPDPKTRAHGFYRKLGWRATGRVIGDDEIMVLRSPEAYQGAAADAD